MTKKELKSPAQRLQEKLQKEYTSWQRLKQYGCNDPFYADGCNMNLIRNHIIHLKEECEELLNPEKYPQEYYRELPPEVDNNYIARRDEIRENAKISLEVYKKDENYLYLVEAMSKLDDKQRKQCCIENVIRYVTELKMFISSDSVLEMRSHEQCKIYLESFEHCRMIVEKILKNVEEDKLQPMRQLSIFDLELVDDNTISGCKSQFAT